MRKILVVITTKFISIGGLTTVMMNYYKAMDKSNLQIDFASCNIPDETDSAFSYIVNHGSKYYCLGDRKKSLIGYIRNFVQVLQDNSYDVIHVNGNSATMCIELFLSKIMSVKTRIAHGHTTRSSHPIVHKVLRSWLASLCTHRIAVSNETGKWLFKKNYLVLNNAIDVRKYLYNDEIRNRIRKELNLDDCLVIGNVGKLYEPKNQSFILDIFKEMTKARKDIRLVLAGGGELEEELKNKAKELAISDKVLFLGMRNDVQDIIQAFDIFVFPSIYEGLGLALIEAQASGLLCLASDAVPRETKVTDNVEYYRLSEGAIFWADKILNMKIYDRKSSVNRVANSIRNCGYDIHTEAGKLEEIYRA